jgi:hypothetical protein
MLADYIRTLTTERKNKYKEAETKKQELIQKHNNRDYSWATKLAYVRYFKK